jgi:hypothetical protein
MRHPGVTISGITAEELKNFQNYLVRDALAAAVRLVNWRSSVNFRLARPRLLLLAANLGSYCADPRKPKSTLSGGVWRQIGPLLSWSVGI